MNRTAIVVAGAALICSAATALAFAPSRTIAQTSPGNVSVGVDLNTDGNSGSSVGATDVCRSAAVGDTLNIDIVVRGVPPAASGATDAGIAGFAYNFHYNPAVLNVTAVDNTLMLGGDSPFQIIQANYTRDGSANPLPSTSGDMRDDFADLSPNRESGDGVLSRLTIKAIGAGRSDLTVDGEVEFSAAPTLALGSGDSYNVSELQNATLTVGQPCDSPPSPINPNATPVPSVTPVRTPGPSASVVPAGDTKLAVDAITTGNEATTAGTIDACASANAGETFQVDVVITGVTDLLAWEMPISFDPAVVSVEDHDVKLFQAANQGSQVFDASNQTPNDTGTYVASAFDSADPPAPDSGDGVLVRLTLKAIGTGTSKLSIAPVDLNGDGNPDRGVLLRTIDNAIIGDTNHDTFFDGPASDAEIRVGSDCAGGGHVVLAQAQSSSPSTTGGGDSSNTWIWAAVAGAVVVIAAGGLGFLFMRRRRGSVAP